jgi:hypothetical protein
MIHTAFIEEFYQIDTKRFSALYPECRIFQNKGGKMKRIVALCVGMMLVMGFSSFAMAANPTKDDAKGLVKKAVTYFKANGKEKSLAEFSNAKGQFVKGELYLTVWDFNGVQIAHGSNPTLIGKNLLNLKDKEDKPFVKDFMATGKKGSGWVSYKWTNPVSKAIETKHTYLEAVNDIIIGAGVYE